MKEQETERDFFDLMVFNVQLSDENLVILSHWDKVFPSNNQEPLSYDYRHRPQYESIPLRNVLELALETFAQNDLDNIKKNKKALLATSVDTSKFATTIISGDRIKTLASVAETSRLPPLPLYSYLINSRINGLSGFYSNLPEEVQDEDVQNGFVEYRRSLIQE